MAEEVAVDSEAVRQGAVSPGADGLRRDPVAVAAVVALRVAEASIADRHSVLPAADAPVREAASPAVARGCSRARVLISELVSDHRLVPVGHDQELAPDSCRLVGHDPGPASASDRELAPDNYLPEALALASASDRGAERGLRAVSGRARCLVLAAGRGWVAEIASRTCPRLDKSEPGISRIAWRAAATVRIWVTARSNGKRTAATARGRGRMRAVIASKVAKITVTRPGKTGRTGPATTATGITAPGRAAGIRAPAGVTCGTIIPWRRRSA